MRSRALLSMLTAGALLCCGCETDEYALLITAESPEVMRNVDVLVVSRDDGSRFRSGVRPVTRLSRDGGPEGLMRVAVQLPSAGDYVVHLLARTVEEEPYGAVRCYHVEGVVTDAVLLVHLDRTLDTDGDGFARTARDVCFAAGGGRCAENVECPGEVGSDCNDDAPSVHPGARETCADSIDQDCDGFDALCEDRDGDGYRICSGTDARTACDCDDGVESVHPGAEESEDDPAQCGDGIDQNCDGSDTLCDRDGDNFPADRARGGSPDCDDENPLVNPAALEVCTCPPDTPCESEPVDEDCDGLFDELSECTSNDLDLDGYDACEVASGGECDCNDCDPGVHPGGRDACGDGIDGDCDAMRVDRVCAEQDTDKDGYVSQGAGGTDCDDDNPRAYPGAPEICPNPPDNDGTPFSESCGARSCDEDLDHDGIAEIDACETSSMLRPFGEETCNGRDDDCDGTTDETLSLAAGCVFNDPRNPACDRRHCVIDYATDLLHCGRCRANCNEGSFVADRCMDGACDCSGEDGMASCEAGRTCCTNGCKDLQNDFASCGTCGNACDERADACSGGRCTCGGGTACGEGLLCCGGECVDPNVDVRHCRMCDNACGAGQICGASGCECVAPRLDCDMAQPTGCEIDPRTDPANCGGCGIACAARQHCQDMRCVCDSPFADCDGSAANGCEIDPRSDVMHCNRCGNACSFAHASAACSDSTCDLVSCAAGFDSCSGGDADGCETDITTTANCGECGEQCGTGETCSGGACHCGTGVACDANETCCGTRCRNLATSEAACGACGVSCGPGERCTSGRCTCGSTSSTTGPACASGTDACCSDVCVDTRTDPDNCGSCGGTCAPEEGTCMAGACRCGVGGPRCSGSETCCASGCSDPAIDVNNCGGCGIVCAVGETCSGSCISLGGPGGAPSGSPGSSL